MCAIDWHLVLEFVKALAGPIATVVAALIAVRFALRIFLGQKTIERRLEWFTRLYSEIDTLIASVVNMGSLIKLQKPEALEIVRKQFHASSEQLRPTCDQAVLYASRTAFKEIQRLRVVIIEFHRTEFTEGLKLENVLAFTEVCNGISQSLSADIRKELGLLPLSTRQ